MATLEQSFLNMMDLYKNTTSTGAVADVMEVLNDLSQDIMSDWTMIECNQGTNHLHSIRTGLPSVAWGALYEGIPQSRTQMQQVTDTTGFAEALCSVDKRVLDLYADKQAIIRSRESQAFVESMAQEAVKALFYHNSNTNARLPHGLAARYTSYAASPTASAGAANQVIHGGGSGADNTSIWFVTWGGQGTNIIYPKGMNAGITQEDKGEQRVTDAAGNPYFVMEELVKLHMGVTVGDWRRNVRIANIDVSNMQAGSVDLYSLMRKAYYRAHGLRKSGSSIRNDTRPGRTVIYCNRDVMEALDGLATNVGGGDNFVRLRPMELEGKEVLSYRGIPIRETDTLINAEALVPAA
jgi:hypothetical protein